MEGQDVELILTEQEKAPDAALSTSAWRRDALESGSFSAGRTLSMPNGASWIRVLDDVAPPNSMNREAGGHEKTEELIGTDGISHDRKPNSRGP